MGIMPLLLTISMVLSARTNTTSSNTAALSPINSNTQQQEQADVVPDTTGWIAEQILTGADGEIHYSYYLPKSYDKSKTYPMVVAMPGYDRMWFGKESSGRNLDWNGAQVWTKQEEDIIVVSAQLTDWGKTSARQSIELTEYFLQNFSVDKSRVYATGYSAGGESMSQAVSMRPTSSGGLHLYGRG